MDTGNTPNKDKGAFATSFECANTIYHQEGITKLEYFAGLALQGLLASGHRAPGESVAQEAVLQAKFLLDEIEKTK